MPNRRVHLKFDEYLREHGIITGYTYADKVHDRMDRDVKNMVRLIENWIIIMRRRE
jgi:hypothetical protein